MSIQFRCPGCYVVIRAAASRAGTNADCPKCGTAMEIPSPPAAAPPIARTAPTTFVPTPLVSIDAEPEPLTSTRRGGSGLSMAVGVAIAILALIAIVAVLMANSGGSAFGGGDAGQLVEVIPRLFLAVLLVALVLFLYMVPTFIASRRRHPNIAAIAALNILLGWAFIGWVAALVWSLTEVQSRDHYHFHDGPERRRR